ncbi:MAG: PA14 domain-containing protein, partial [Acidimicrobiales bacterium]
QWWWDQQPGPLVPATNFLVRWQGSITVPVNGTYTFGASVNDGARIRLDLDNNGTYETTALDSWQDQFAWPVPVYGPAVATPLVAGQSYGIRMDYYQHADQSFVALVAKGPFGPGNSQAEWVVPPSWLSSDAPLPEGWTLGTGQAYVGARVGETAVTFTDGAGHGHVYTWTGNGYAPTPGEDGVVSLDATSGTITLHDADGQTYAFDRAGRLSVATAPTEDNLLVSSTCYGRDANGRLRIIFDPVAGRFMTLAYGGVPTNPHMTTPCNQAEQSGPACNQPVVPQGYQAAPAGRLCQINYWDGTSTNLWYLGKQLGRIEEPGNPATSGNPPDRPPLTDFTYRSGDGKLVTVTEPLANDAVRAGLYQSGDNTIRTEIGYDTPGSNPALSPKVQTVTRPAPVALAPRELHTYGYGSPATVTVAGLVRSVSAGWTAPANPVDRRFTISDTTPGATNPVMSVYDAGRRSIETTDPAQRKTVTVRDGDPLLADHSPARGSYLTGRVTDTYGPGPTSCFTSGVPPYDTGSCAELPRVTTRYDAKPDAASLDKLANLIGLRSAWWNNPDLGGGLANLSTFGAQGAIPKIHRDPDASTPFPVTPPPEVGAIWSVRYAGEIEFVSQDQSQPQPPRVGDYPFTLSAAGRARLYVDDRLVFDTLSPPQAGFAAVAGARDGRHRIRVDYQPSGTPSLALTWKPPGTTSFVAVPTSSLFPRYGNAARTTTHESPGVPANVVDNVYVASSTGVVSQRIVDPMGANPRITRTGYEALGPGGQFVRPKTRRLPADVADTDTATQTTYDYDPVSGPLPCGLAAVDQGGALRLETGPDPGDGSHAVQAMQYAYDKAGRVVGTRRNFEYYPGPSTEAWTCTTYDKRGRPTQVSIPGYRDPDRGVDQPSRTVPSPTSSSRARPTTSSIGWRATRRARSSPSSTSWVGPSPTRTCGATRTNRPIPRHPPCTPTTRQGGPPTRPGRAVPAKSSTTCGAGSGSSASTARCSPPPTTTTPPASSPPWTTPTAPPSPRSWRTTLGA